MGQAAVSEEEITLKAAAEEIAVATEAAGVDEISTTDSSQRTVNTAPCDWSLIGRFGSTAERSAQRQSDIRSTAPGVESQLWTENSRLSSDCGLRVAAMIQHSCVCGQCRGNCCRCVSVSVRTTNEVGGLLLRCERCG